jgi:hypothetical protein
MLFASMQPQGRNSSLFYPVTLNLPSKFKKKTFPTYTAWLLPDLTD